MCGHLIEEAEGLRGRTLRHEQRVDAQRLVGLGLGLGAGLGLWLGLGLGLGLGLRLGLG